MEFIGHSNIDSCSDTEGKGTSGDEYDDVRDEIDWTAESNAIQVEQSTNEIQETATEKTVEVTITEQASKTNDNTVVPGENVLTAEEKLGRHYDEQGLRKSTRISNKKQYQHFDLLLFHMLDWLM